MEVNATENPNPLLGTQYIMKKTTKTLLLVFSSLLLLLTAVVSSSAQDRPQEFQTLTGRIRWKKDMGVVPKASSSNEPSENICAPFYVGVILQSATDNSLVAYTDVLERGRDEGDYYICRYTINKVPAKISIMIMIGMGDVFSLPKPTKLPFHYTMPWILEDGSKASPPRRFIRSFTQNNKQLAIGSTKGTYLGIDLIYTPLP